VGDAETAAPEKEEEEEGVEAAVEEAGDEEEGEEDEVPEVLNDCRVWKRAAVLMRAVSAAACAA
jgi:hypothetical protein